MHPLFAPTLLPSKVIHSEASDLLSGAEMQLVEVRTFLEDYTPIVVEVWGCGMCTAEGPSELRLFCVYFSLTSWTQVDRSKAPGPGASTPATAATSPGIPAGISAGEPAGVPAQEGGRSSTALGYETGAEISPAGEWKQEVAAGGFRIQLVLVSEGVKVSGVVG